MNLKFRKKPVVIEAFKMTEERRASNADWPEWMHRAWQLDREAPGSTEGLGRWFRSAEVDALMKRCQGGVGGRHALDNAHSIMADCYGTLGALAAELEAMHDMRRELQAEIARLQERCARYGMEARSAERERLRGYFRDALADTGITWPGEVDSLYDKCFATPYVPDEAA